jgi:hypothetical protein
MNQNQMKSSWERGQCATGSLYAGRLQHYVTAFFPTFRKNYLRHQSCHVCFPKNSVYGMLLSLTSAVTDLAFILSAAPLQRPPLGHRSCQMAVRSRFRKDFVIDVCWRDFARLQAAATLIMLLYFSIVLCHTVNSLAVKTLNLLCIHGVHLFVSFEFHVSSKQILISFCFVFSVHFASPPPQKKKT